MSNKQDGYYCEGCGDWTGSSIGYEGDECPACYEDEEDANGLFYEQDLIEQDDKDYEAEKREEKFT